MPQSQSQPTQVQTEAQSASPLQLDVPDEDSPHQQMNSDANLQQATVLPQPMAAEQQPETQPPSQIAVCPLATASAGAAAVDESEHHRLSEGEDEFPRTKLQALNLAGVPTEAVTDITCKHGLVM